MNSKAASAVSPIKVLFDWDAVIRNEYSGFFTFGKGLVEAISKADNQGLKFTLMYQKRYAKASRKVLKSLSASRGAMPFNHKEVTVKFRWLEGLWNIIPYPRLETLAGAHHIYHCFHHFMPPKFNGIKLLTVHDLRRYRLPQLYKKSNLKPFEAALKRADHFVCVSKATKRDLCSIFDIPDTKVDVVHLATSSLLKEATKPVGQALSRLGVKEGRYFVCFSSKDKRKNVSRICQAFHVAQREFSQKLALIVIGKIDKEEMEKVQAIQGVHCIGPVEQVHPWLSGSIGLAFASLYEGFGLPILEAFQAGVPVITSKTSSMPEVAGEAALLVDPYDINDIAQAMIQLGNSRELRKRLASKGEKRLQCFSWEKSADQMVSLYKRLSKYQRR